MSNKSNNMYDLEAEPTNEEKVAVMKDHERIHNMLNDLEAICRNDIDIARAYLKSTTKTIKITNIKKKQGFIYDDLQKLYIEFAPSMLYSSISDYITGLMNDMSHVINTAHYFKETTLKVIQDNEKVKKTYEGRVKKIQSVLKTSSRLDSVIACIIPECYDIDFVTKMNADINELPISGGMIIDLKTKAIRERTNKDYYTYALDVEYKPSKYKKFRKVLTDICTGNIDKLNYLSMVLGASLTVDQSSKCYWILYGKSGDNGKSFLLNVMNSIFNKFTCVIPQEVIFSTDATKIKDTDYGQIFGKRLGFQSEPSSKFLCEVSIKQITGGDNTYGRVYYSDKFEFKPTTKIFIASNELVYMDTTSEALMSRLRVISFDSRFVSNPTNENEYKIDVDLFNKLTGKYKNEVFSYLVDYASLYLNSDDRKAVLQQPESLMREKEAYITKIDKLKSFIHECCVLGDRFYVKRVEFKRMFDTYLTKNNQYKPNEKKIAEQMERMFKLIKHNGHWSYKGLRFKQEDDDNDDDLEYGIHKPKEEQKEELKEEPIESKEIEALRQENKDLKLQNKDLEQQNKDFKLQIAKMQETLDKMCMKMQKKPKMKVKIIDIKDDIIAKERVEENNKFLEKLENDMKMRKVINEMAAVDKSINVLF